MASLLRQPLLQRTVASAAAASTMPLGLFLAGRQPTALAACGVCRAGLRRQSLLQQEQQPQQRRRYAAPAPRRKQAPRSAGAAPSVVMRQQMASERTPAMISFRIPMTFVSPPMAQHIKTPTVFAKLLWYRCRTHVTDWLSEMAVRFQSKPALFKAARYKPDKKAIVPAAKALHYQMLEATAAADTTTLGRLLTRGHLDEVAGLLARRPRGRRCAWELLAYKGRPWIVDSKTIMIPGTAPMYMRQVVVAIRSRQRFTWKDGGAGSPPKPSTIVEKDVRENVVLVAILDQNTWQTSEWRIFGFLPLTTLDSWMAEKKLLDTANKENLTLG